MPEKGETIFIGDKMVAVKWLGMRGTCRDCGVQFEWVQTLNKRRHMPVVLVKDRYESHFADCPGAAKFRKKPDNQSRLL